ncbi:lipid II flippase MurJ [Corynebacterium breve]|uniref:Lipid II flippase MurJ n=1 Tax=Corynebacterium breve TaxID=3049799 RepID=A0ABY8VDE3_9CORY|nr:lipid II flippase MurJ [Corynebacterium breve]WIM67680.1 lipid II flippase MurJ [Corynebacterium breve]
MIGRFVDSHTPQPQDPQRPLGQRRRIVTPTPPAPVPVPRKAPAPVAEPVEDRSMLTTSPSGATLVDEVPTPPETSEVASNEDVVRSTGSMAIATLLSRITGFIRTVMITSMLGGAIASAFNLANTLPNMITEIVLGSVLTALVVPVLVRAEKEDADRGARFIRQLFTLTLTLMLGVTVIAVVAAPWLVGIMMEEDAKTNSVQTTSFAYLLLPQIFFYGMFSLFMAICNTKGVFRPGAWAPVANNVISISVLATYRLVPGSLNPAAPSSVADPHVLLLGLGTTLGVVVQCLIMLPSLKRLKIDLRPQWGIDDRLKEFGGMAVAIIAYVAISQLGYVITSRIATAADESAYAIYQQHWQLLQVPYGIIGVTLLTAIMPRLSHNAADGDDKAVVRDLTLATKLTFIALVPIIVFMTALGPDIGNALFGYGAFTGAESRILGLTISFSAFTLIPYALVMLHLRVFYAREEAWTPTFIIAGITLTKVVLSSLAPLVASSTQNVVVLLGAANGFGFVAGAMIGAFLLRRKLGSLQFHTILRTTLWALASGIVGIAVALLGRFIVRLTPLAPTTIATSLGMRDSIGLLVELAIEGVIFLIVTGIVLSRSGLPEVQNLGRVFSRIPGLGRFIRPNEDKAIEVGETDPRAMSQQFLLADSFNSSPIPPPMSAGVVRGPRLVPGAPVSDGKFRLLAEHGSVAGAQFWHAREIATGREVALTFVDTQGQAPMAPVTPDEAARKSAQIARQTRVLRDLNHPAIAPNISVLSYRSGCLIVADWIPGSSVKAVAESGETLHPEAVANGIAPLSDVMACALDRGISLGLDNRNRLRVSTEGNVMLAFPAVLPNANSETDLSSLASALELLTSATGDDAGAQELPQIAKRARTLADDLKNPDNTNPTADQYRELAADLNILAGGVPLVDEAATDSHGPDTESIPVIIDETPNPDHVSGFGSRGYSAPGFLAIVGAAIAVVVLIAALTTYLVSVVGASDPEAPVAHEAVEGEEGEALGRPLPIIVDLASSRVWQAPGQDAGADNPDQVANLIDGNPDTSWSSDEYPNGLGTKPGIGVVVTAQEQIELQHVAINTETPGARYAIYGLPNDRPTDAETTPLEELDLLRDGTLRTARNTLEIEGNPEVHGVVIWISELPANREPLVTISEVNLIGIPLDN